MPNEKNTDKGSLHELEKLVKKIIRKSLKDSTLDYTVQISISSLEPGRLKYATQISSPSRGVEPITFIYDTYADLKNSLAEAVEGIDKKQVEIAFHQSRVNTYEHKIAAHKKRMDQLEKGEVEEDDIEMEEV